MSTIFPGPGPSSLHRTFDVIVIGAGPAGALAAMTAREEGARVAIIEEMHGGTLSPVGRGRVVPAIDRSATEVASAEYLAGTFRIVGMAEFVSPSAIRAGGHIFEAGAFVIATGSVARRPAISGLAREYACAPEDLTIDESLPRRIAVLGAGPAGLELAQACARSGATVTVLDTNPALLLQSPACGEMLARAVGREVDIRLGIRICGVRTLRQGVELRWTSGSTTTMSHAIVDRVVFALGRAPRVQHLALERAAVDQFAGVAIVDSYRRTTNPRVWMAGDDTPGADGPDDDYRRSQVAGYNAAHPIHPKPADPRWPVRIIATDPSYASVGEPEPIARTRLGELYAAGRRYSTPRARARATQGVRRPTRKDGLVRMWADRNGYILGGEAIGEGADLLMHLLAHSIAQGYTVESLQCLHFSPRSIAHALLTISEALLEATPATTRSPHRPEDSAQTEQRDHAGRRPTAQASLGRVSAVPPAASG